MGLTGPDVGGLASLACLLEASAPKPGNVSPGRPFRDMRYEDFLLSALAIGPVLGQAGGMPVGQTILSAVEATRTRTRANTNLGIVLLFAPLARAALASPGSPLQAGVCRILEQTTVDDAALAYRAIRLAHPGGLGDAATQDVGQAPSVTLVEAMRLAADRDSVAAEYAGGYRLTFGIPMAALRRARSDGLGWTEAVTESFLTLLARVPDTLIGRKLGRAEAERVSDGAARVLQEGGVREEAGRRALASFDVALRDEQNTRNPGTTADLTAAALFAMLLEDGWPAP